MERFGDETSGFSVVFDQDTLTVRVEGWGFWSADVASKFGPAVRSACTNRPRGTALKMDLTRLKPMRDEGQDSFGLIVGSLAALGIERAAVATGSPLTRLQLLRIAGERAALDRTQVL